MLSLEYSTLVPRTPWEAYTYLKDQLLEKMQPVYEYGYYGYYGQSYNYTPWQGAIYLALLNDWEKFLRRPWVMKLYFQNDYRYRKYNNPQSYYYTGYPLTSFSVAMLLMGGIIGMMNCYAKNGKTPGMTSSSIGDLVNYGYITSITYSDYLNDYGITDPLESHTYADAFELRGVKIMSTTLVLYWSKLIASFKYMVKYNEDTHLFYVDDTFGE